MTEREMMRRKAAARRARKERERKARNRRVVMTVALMLAVCIASIGGTIAWLTDKTEVVTNTFSPSNINLELKETIPANKTANMIPGGVIAKNPHAIIANDVDAYLFVEIEESTEPDLDTYIKWGIADGWELLEKDENSDKYVYWRLVRKDQAGEYNILRDNQVSVLTTVTKDDMDAIEGEDQPTLTFMAYAIQYENGNGTYFKPAEAWKQLNSATDSPVGGDTEGDSVESGNTNS